MKNSVKSATKKTSFIDAVLSGEGLELDTRMTQTSQTETAQIEALQVPAFEAQLEEAAEKFIFAPLRNGVTFPHSLDFSKFVFNLLEVPRDLGGTEEKALSKNKLYCEAYETIKSYHEKRKDAPRKDAPSTFAFIDQHYHKWINPEKFKGNGNSETVKAKSAKPDYTAEQKAALKALENNPLLKDAYEATKAVFDAELQDRINIWAKEQIESDKKSKMVFVKNFIRQNNNIEFLNSLYELCKNREAEELMFEQNKTEAPENTPINDDDNKPF